MRCGVVMALVLVVCAQAAQGQGVVGDVLMGNLVKPEAGVWALYDLTDAGSGSTYQVRVAIVGEEKVDAKTGYWLEMEMTPTVGFKTVYKMLLTGPATDAANIHKIFRRQGDDPVEEVEVLGKKATKDSKSGPEESKTPEPDRTRVGEEDLKTAGGEVHAEHFEINKGGKKLDVWLNESVRPTGVAQMKSEDGALVLRKYGTGGENAHSVMDGSPVKPQPEKKSDVQVNVRVDKNPKKARPKGKTP